jgi:hypothetical protein
MVLGDISLLNPMRALSLLKNKEFHVSCFSLTGYYLNANEKIILKNLEQFGCVEIFELGNDFYEFCNKNTSQNFAITELSSIYYAKQMNLPLVTEGEKIANFAIQNNIEVYKPNKALSLINVGQERIDFLNSMMKIA